MVLVVKVALVLWRQSSRVRQRWPRGHCWFGAGVTWSSLCSARTALLRTSTAMLINFAPTYPVTLPAILLILLMRVLKSEQITNRLQILCKSTILEMDDITTCYWPAWGVFKFAVPLFTKNAILLILV